MQPAQGEESELELASGVVGLQLSVDQQAEVFRLAERLIEPVRGKDPSKARQGA